MNLKLALLAALEAEQLKDLCNAFELDADRRSPKAMAEALAATKRAKSEVLIEKLAAAQLREVLRDHELPTRGSKEELQQRLLEAGGRGSAPAAATAQATPHKTPVEPSQAANAPVSNGSDLASEYRHADLAVQRPSAGVQDQFQTKKPPTNYRFDSSLDPALSWDEQRERDLGEWLLTLIVRAGKEGEKAVFGEPQSWKGGNVRVSSSSDAAQVLQQISKPFLNWAGKAERAEIRVPTVPLFVHERHSTKAVLDSIRNRKARGETLDLFGDAGMDVRENLEAYEHKGPWQNRMILGDSLGVMNSLIEFEGLGGQVQMIYMDPPYGVKFGSNFQPFVRKRGVTHGSDDDMTREPEMVKAYRDTWELGLHSYLSYLRDRIALSRELLSESGSLFIQISDDNLHFVREVAGEIFGNDNFVGQITFQKTGGFSPTLISSNADYILWFSKDKRRTKYKALFTPCPFPDVDEPNYVWLDLPDGGVRRMTPSERRRETALPDGARIFRHGPLTSDGAASVDQPFEFDGVVFRPNANSHWKTTLDGLSRLVEKGLIIRSGSSIAHKMYWDNFAAEKIGNIWLDTQSGGFTDPKLYVVQTTTKTIQRCLLMSTDPGDLVLDPTCGSGTTAYVAEQWGRRWITIDTSRVPLALARQRLLTATFPYFKLKTPQAGPAGGFVYERKQNRKGEEVGGLVPHVTLGSIANGEPPSMEVLVDRPEDVPSVTRVAGPFVVEATIAPVQSLEAAGEASAGSADVATHIQRMTEVLRQSKTLQLPHNRELTLSGIRRTVDTEYIHAEAKESDNSVAVVFGPADGAISSTLVLEAAREAYARNFDRLYFFGFAIEPGARALIEDAKKLRPPASYVAVTPDVAMSDLLKTTRSSEIFSVTGLPDAILRSTKKKGPDGEALYEVELRGLDLFDPQSLETESVQGESLPCWMLDTNYDGLCFYATQVFFPRTSAWDNLQRSLRARFDETVWSHLAGTVSEPFALGKRRRIAVKVIDERGNELMSVVNATE